MIKEIFEGFILPQLDEQLNSEWLNEEQYEYLVSKSELLVTRVQEFYKHYEKNSIELESDVELEYLDNLFTEVLNTKIN